VYWFFLWRSSVEMLSSLFIFLFIIPRAGYQLLGFRVTHGWSYGGSCRPSYRRFGIVPDSPRSSAPPYFAMDYRQAQHVTSIIYCAVVLFQTYVEKATDLMIFYRIEEDVLMDRPEHQLILRNHHRSRCSSRRIRQHSRLLCDGIYTKR
jgi:hypothetical protein